MYLTGTADFVKVALIQQPFELQSMAWAQNQSFLMIFPLAYQIWFGIVWFKLGRNQVGQRKYGHPENTPSQIFPNICQDVCLGILHHPE